MKLGYARVSTEEQELGRQLTALKKAGCEKIYTDKISGMKSSRPQFDKLISEMQPGDTIVIQKLDRLGRSMKDLLRFIEEFKERGVALVSLNDNLNFDKNNPMGNFMFHMVAAFAQLERDLTAERTKDGLKYARSRGSILGRRKLGVDSAEVMRLKSHGMGASEIARELKISRSSVYNLLNDYHEFQEQYPLL